MIKIIVLAAGKGTRMKSELPKVLVPVSGEPMICRLVRSIKKSGVDLHPILIVSPDNQEIIIKTPGLEDVDFAIQEKQLGTGHAVACAENNLKDKAGYVIVMNGDHPFIQPETIKKLAESEEATIAMLMTKLEDFDDWRSNFYHWGRVIIENGKAKGIIEFKDADEKTKEIKEVNPAIYRFKADWLWENIGKIGDNNAQKEFYLTDLIKKAFLDNRVIKVIEMDAKEAMGINSFEELKVAEKIYAANT